jgi:hypothetical protein
MDNEQPSVEPERLDEIAEKYELLNEEVRERVQEINERLRPLKDEIDPRRPQHHGR